MAACLFWGEGRGWGGPREHKDLQVAAVDISRTINAFCRLSKMLCGSSRAAAGAVPSGLSAGPSPAMVSEGLDEVGSAFGSEAWLLNPSAASSL